MPPIIALDTVSKTFPNGTRALSQMSLAIAAGEFVSLLGPSGCGKSTVLRLIAGLDAPTTGTIDWPMAERSGQNDIGFVFQEPTLLPWATVYENVRLPLRLKGLSKRESDARIRETLDMVGLTSFASAFPRELSGGMRMRVSIARALVMRPNVLLMDEPFAALDEITRNRLNDDLLQLWQAHRWTVVFVTHSVHESVYLSNRIVVMAAHPGRVADDRPIAAPYPRGEAFRLSTDYATTCRQVSGALHATLTAEDAA